MVRPPCCDKLNVKRGLWTEEEDVKMLAYVSKHGTGNWTAVPKKAGLRRCGKSCRLRWTNYLRPDLKHESFTPQEEELIVRLHAAIGSRWSIIAQQLPGRTDNDVKNYWNTKLKKKLSEMGIDPVTHKPFSQILADYGNIGGLPKSGTRIGSLNRDLKTAFMLKLDQYRAPPPPKPEPIQDQSLDLLAQLQAIKLVAEASNCSNLETIPPQFFTEGPLMSASSSCSSSSACWSAARERPSSQTFSWKDFLLEEPFLPADLLQGQEDMAEFLSKDLISESEVNSQITKNLHNGVPSNSFEASSSSDSSFLEALLNRDNEMFLEFHDLLEEPLY